MSSTVEYRIRYDYPYLEKRGETKWTPPFGSYSEAFQWMDSYYVTGGYGRVLEVQTREIKRGEWESTDEQ